jgi:hypothetical protein
MNAERRPRSEAASQRAGQPEVIVGALYDFGALEDLVDLRKLLEVDGVPSEPARGFSALGAMWVSCMRRESTP